MQKFPHYKKRGIKIWQCWGGQQEASVNHVEGVFTKHVPVFFLDVYGSVVALFLNQPVLFSTLYFPLQLVLQCWLSVSFSH